MRMTSLNYFSVETLTCVCNYYYVIINSLIIFFVPGSVIASAWRAMTEEWENISRLIKANAEALESKALDRLTALMTERRKSRKVYQEDHTKISSQFTQVRLVLSYFSKFKRRKIVRDRRSLYNNNRDFNCRRLLRCHYGF